MRSAIHINPYHKDYLTRFIELYEHAYDVQLTLSNSVWSDPFEQNSEFVEELLYEFSGEGLTLPLMGVDQIKEHIGFMEHELGDIARKIERDYWYVPPELKD